MTGAWSYKRAIGWLTWNSKGFFEAFPISSFHSMLDLTFSNKHVVWLINIKGSVWITIWNYLANLWGSFGRRAFEKKAMTNLESILKNRHYIANKVLSSQTVDFSSSHVWTWELDYKESWALKNWCFWTLELEKILESPLDCKEIQPVNPKGN